MSPIFKEAMQRELNIAKEYYRKEEYSLSFSHLERYHILSQPFYSSHLNSHWWMFKIGIRLMSPKEIFGQLVRMIGSIGSLFGKYPVGNTGGANVSPFKPMPIPEDLKPLFEHIK